MIEKRKQFDAPRQGTGQRRLFAERRERRSTEEQRVHDVDDRPCVAPRHVLFATHSAELAREEIGGNAEQARFGATKTIDRLLGVADHEDARPRRVRIGIEPRTQNLPLQRIGVLELVQQHMLVTRVETGLQERRGLFVAQQLEHLPLRVDKIDLPPRLLERVDMRQERREHGTRPPVEQQNALGNLALKAGQHPLAEAGMQIQETRRTGGGEAFVQCIPRFSGAQRVVLGQ